MKHLVGVFPIVLLLLGPSGCGPAGEEPFEQQPSVPSCDMAGTWRLTEVLAESTCEDWEPGEGGALVIREVGDVYEFLYRPPEGTTIACTGTPQEDPCSLGLTCGGALADVEVELALEVELDPGSGTLSGTERLDAIELECQMTYELTGEIETP